MSRRARPLALAVAAFALHALPSAALACAVCGAGAERNRLAFLGTTILLSLLPLAMIGGGLWWIARHARGRLAGEFTERDALAAGSPRSAGTAAGGAAAGPRPAVPGAAPGPKPAGIESLLATPGAGLEA